MICHCGLTSTRNSNATDDCPGARAPGRHAQLSDSLRRSPCRRTSGNLPVDSIFELNRGAWDLLTRPQRGNNFKPPVRSVLVRHGGKGHGIKLIDVRSALVVFSSLPNEVERLGQAA